MLRAFRTIGQTIIEPAVTEASSSPCELAGEWIPCRTDEWYNRNPGKHSKRAQMPHTLMTYAENGRGEGWVGDVYVHVSATKLADGQYSATAKVKKLLWMATDGRLTLNKDTGELEVRYSSNGIIEYWIRKGGNPGNFTSNSLEMEHPPRLSGQTREVQLLLRRVKGMPFQCHWAIQVGDSIFELNGAMAVYGPDGIVAANSLMLLGPSKGTRTSQFHGRLGLSRRSSPSNEEIETFSRQWIKKHPIYSPAGPNCQTYAEDLYIFLTGESLPFSKVGDLKKGPEYDDRVRWMDPSKKP